MRVLYIIIVILGGGAILWATINTQVVHGDMWRAAAKEREATDRVEPARRGTIYSSDGKVLAITVPVCDLCLDLGCWPKTDQKGKTVVKDGRVVIISYTKNDSAFLANLGQVCKILHEHYPAKSVKDFHDRIMNEYSKAKPSRCLYIQRNVPYSQWATIKRLEGWNNCVVTKTLEGSVTHHIRAHIYGNLGENTIGLHYKEGYTGMEGYYDSVLRGQDGLYRCRRLTRGVWLPVDEEDIPADEDSMLLLKRRIDGQSIVSTIDTRYQDIAEDALRQSMNKFGGQRGCAILMEVATGHILACSNLTRDTMGHLAENLWSNVACSDRYEPGSTFKTVAMLAMLNDKSIGLDTSKRVQCGGQKQFSAKSGVINDGHGYNTDTSNLAGVLAHSSNVGMCELAWQYYRTRRQDFKSNIEAIFPFGVMTPDVAASETRTRIVPLNSDRDFLNLSYGYSSTVTPLQLITFYNAIANNGKMVKPIFCQEIIDGSHHKAIEPIVLKEAICTPEIAKQMREMLIGVVEHGTGSNIKGTSYGIGGKTGTALLHQDRSIKNSSFIGFFPAENPRYTCLVLVESTSIAGREVAAPVVKRIADCVVAFDSELGSIHLQDSGRVVRPISTKAPRHQMELIHQLLGMPFVVVDSTNATQWVHYDNGRGGYANYEMPKNQVPDCKGMTVRDAITLCNNVGMKVKFSGQGKVVSQSPKARSKAVKGGTVVLVLKP
ncbi:MAG: transpeptidase family protein [Bacteroidales bacterium]|nr:transpeptidase family protein [Bacteroidales bacterium]